MSFKLYAVVDRKAKQVVNTFTSVNDESAERSFLMLLTGVKNIFTDFPEDFDLFPVAELSFESGSLLVTAHGLENVNKHGFKIDSFNVADPIKRGVDYDKRYLHMVHQDRFPAVIPAPDDSSEVSADET